MVNERLRRSMLRAGLGTEALAETAQVSTKTVERWLRGEVVPYPRTRYRVAAILQEDESYLWPDAVDQAALAGAELVAAYSRRAEVPGHLWTELLRQAGRNVDVLAFAGLFLTEEHPDWTPLLLSRAAAGGIADFARDGAGRQLLGQCGRHRGQDEQKQRRPREGCPCHRLPPTPSIDAATRRRRRRTPRVP